MQLSFSVGSLIYICPFWIINTLIHSKWGLFIDPHIAKSWPKLHHKVFLFPKLHHKVFHFPKLHQNVFLFPKLVYLFPHNVLIQYTQTLMLCFTCYVFLPLNSLFLEDAYLQTCSSKRPLY